jgi:hypothetical protein
MELVMLEIRAKESCACPDRIFVEYIKQSEIFHRLYLNTVRSEVGKVTLKSNFDIAVKRRFVSKNYFNKA